MPCQCDVIATDLYAYYVTKFKKKINLQIHRVTLFAATL